jgi:hypothetical protein
VAILPAASHALQVRLHHTTYAVQAHLLLVRLTTWLCLPNWSIPRSTTQQTLCCLGKL